ncbi:MAG: hypothetical protein U9Q07_07405, partial [Planctomycetota bacterium]|nr:hypothetical protein [Planctomycetota bacterium]
MNVSVSTIGDMFGQTTGAVSALPKPDAPGRAAQFPLAPEEKQSPADTTQQATSHRESSDLRREPVDKGRKNFDEVIRKKTKPEIKQARNQGKPTEQDSKSGTADESGTVQTSLAQHSAAVEHAPGGATTKTKPKTGQQLAQLIAASKTAKSLPV